MPSVYHKYLPINVNNAEIGKLYWQRDFENKEYPGQPLSMLRLDEQILSSGWTAEGVADWICHLFSLCLGREINWNYHVVPSVEQDELPAVRVWHSHRISQESFTAFTEEKGRFQFWIGINEDDWCVKLVEQVFEYLFQMQPEKVDSYLEALNSYIHYISTPSGRPELTCTLLCALGEYIYGLWEDIEKHDHKSSLTKKVRGKILDSIQANVEEYITEIIPQREGESQDEYMSRQSKFKNRLRSTVGSNLASSLTDELKSLFEYYGWYTNTDYPGDNMGHRLEAFVNTRNRLFHEHRFESVELRQKHTEILNVKTIIPLMLVVVLRYKGRYWDSYAHEWRFTKHG